MNFYLTRNGQTFGPFTEEQVRQQVNTGACTLDDLACPVGGQQWLPIRQLLPPSPNQPAAPAPYAPALYPAAAAKRSGSRAPLIWSAIGILLVVLAAAGCYLFVLPAELSVKASMHDVKVPGQPVYHPKEAVVSVYKDVSLRPRIVRAIRAAKAYIRENQGHVDDEKLRSILADLPLPDQLAITDSEGSFTTEVPKVSPYLVLVWDHSTVDGVTMENAWILESSMRGKAKDSRELSEYFVVSDN